MSETQSHSEVIAGLAEEFVARYRNGERPPVSEYTAKHPELADEIREFFGAVALVEKLAPAASEPTSGAPSGGRAKAVPPLTLLGDYRIVKEIGRGGMGVVYEAEQVSLGRHVALKVLPVHVARDPRLLERFRREVRAAAKLHHSNIVPVFEVGEADEVRFYAMQFIQGQSLDTVIDELRRMRTGESSPLPHDRPDGQIVIADSGSFSTDPQTSGRSGRLEPTVAIAQALMAGHFSTPVEAEPTGPVPATQPRASLDPRMDEAATVRDETNVMRLQEQTQALRAGTTTSSSASSISLLGQSDLSIRSGQLSPFYYQSIARIGIQVADALAYAHDRGVVHRDIKPSNLLLDLAGTVWVTDFGLAKEGDDRLTETGDIVGTLRFMAPERFRGAGDARSDLYSLGVTLYELVTLRAAYQGTDHVQLMQSITNAEPARPRSLDPRVPADLETVILKALDKNPDRRYQTAAQLAEDLRCFLDCRPIRARRTGWLERTWRWCRRNPIVAGLTTLAAVLLMVIAVGSQIDSMRLRVELKRVADAEAAERLALQKEKDAHRKTDEARVAADSRLWESLLAQARAGRTSGRPGQRFDSLRAIRDALKLPLPAGQSRDALRNEAIAALCLPDLQVDREWEGCPPGCTYLAVDPAFRIYARGDEDGQIIVFDLADGAERVRFNVDGSISGFDGLRFSPNGRFLRAQFHNSSNGLNGKCFDLTTAQSIPLCDQDTNGFDFNSDGTQCAVAFNDGTLRVIDLATSKEVRHLPVPAVTGYTVLAWNPQRPWLALVSRTSLVSKTAIHILDLSSGEVLKTIADGGRWFDNIGWHPHGRLLAVSTYNSKEILFIDAESGDIVKSIAGQLRPGIVVRFNRHGNRLASNDWSQVIRLWDVDCGRQLVAHPSTSNSLEFSLDDQSLGVGTAGTKALLFRCRAGSEFQTLGASRVRRQSDGSYYARLSGDGRLLASSASGGLALIDMACFQSVAQFPAGTYPLSFGEGDRGLWTHGRRGVERWPLRWEDDERSLLHVGPPEVVEGYATSDYWGSSNQGKIIAAPGYQNGAFVFDMDEKRHVQLTPQRDVRFCSVSPDGRWVATGTHHGGREPSAKVWEAATGNHVADLPVFGDGCFVEFSPDGRWLATSAGRPRLWHVETWDEGPALGPAVTTIPTILAFSHDGSLLALGDAAHSGLRLVQTNSGREIARLTAPGSPRLAPTCFTRDGARLVVCAVEQSSLHVFDLRAIRAQLRDLDLDWDAPELPPMPDVVRSPEPFTVRVDLGEKVPDLSPDQRAPK